MMEHKLSKRRKRADVENIIVSRLSDTLIRIAKYFAEKENRSVYKTAIDFLSLQTYETDASLYISMHVYFPDSYIILGRALRQIILGFIEFDIHKNIILNYKGTYHVNVFDEELIPDTECQFFIPNMKEFKMYSGWKQEWIQSMLKRSMNNHDNELFHKILDRISFDKYHRMLVKLINNKNLPIEYKLYLMEYISDHTENDSGITL